MSESSTAGDRAVVAPKTPFSASTLAAGATLLAGLIVLLSFAPGAYQVFLALHVLSAVVWVGGDITLTTLGVRYERLSDPATLAVLGKVGTWIGTRVYTPALFTTVAFGAAAMAEGDLDYGQFWVIFGLAGWAIASVVGVGFVGPELGRIDEAARTHGPDAPETRRRIKRLFTIFRFDTALLTLTVIVMAAKPDF